MTENTELPMTEQDQIDIEKMMANPPKRTRSLAEVWINLMEASMNVRAERIHPRAAARIAASHTEVSIAEVPRYYEIYYEYLDDFERILVETVLPNKKAIYSHVEDDAEENASVYLNLLLLWQSQVLVWESEWDIHDPEAGVRLAAMSDAYNFVLAPDGMVAHLDQIGFQLTEDLNKLLIEGLSEVEESLAKEVEGE